MRWTPPDIVACKTSGTTQWIVDTLTHLGLPVLSHPDNSAWQLAQLDTDAADTPIGRLGLIRPDKVALSIDFTAGKTRHRYNESGHGAQQLSKALGIKAKPADGDIEQPDLQIIDTTGGMGQDAWAIASLGWKVTVYESHPIIHALLSNALQRASLHTEFSDTAALVRLVHGDATDGLKALANGETQASPTNAAVHAAYLDPMYPPRRKSSSTKKAMQFLHTLLGPPDAERSRQLLTAALQAGLKRVVVKRPKGAPELEGTEQWQGQLTHLQSPNTRYDIYHQPQPGTR